MPRQIGDILSQLMARRGYARVLSAEELRGAWASVAPQPLGRFTRAGALKRGVLEVLIANSAVLQELTFQKPALLDKLRQRLPDEKLKDLRFRIGPIE